MALMSDPIAVADATPWAFGFVNFRSAVNVQVRFYTDAEATEASQLSPRGTGSRDLTATNVTTAYAGRQLASTSRQTLESGINNGTIAAAVDGTWYELGLGGGLGQVTISAATNVTPGSAVSYRIIVDADGYSVAG